MAVQGRTAVGERTPEPVAARDRAGLEHAGLEHAGLEHAGLEHAGLERDLVERDGELAALSSAVDAAARRRGEAVLIEGPPGAGRTVLLEAATTRARATGVRVLAGRGRESERAVAFGAALDLLTPAVLAAPDGERARLLDGLAAPAARLLLDPGADRDAPTDAFVLGLCWVAARLTGSDRGPTGATPLLLVLDDAQWADAPSAWFLARLADWTDRLPLSLVLAVREGESAHDPGEAAASRELRAHSRMRILTLAPLSADAVGSLTAAAFPASGPEPVRELAEAVARASGGNPFFVCELLRSLRGDAAGGELPESGPESVHATAFAAASPAVSADAPRRDQHLVPSPGAVARLVPATVLRSVRARISRLTPDACRLADSLAVLGGDTPLRRAAAHAALPLAAAERAADLLVAARLLRPGSPLAFAHPLIGTALYADLPGFARARAHRRAADLVAADSGRMDVVAAHLLAAEPEGDAWCAEVLGSAARRALLRGDAGAAADLLTRALAEPPPADSRISLLMRLAEAGTLAGRPDAHRPLLEALELLPEAEVHARADALSALARIHHARGDLERAAEAGGQALDLLDPRDPRWPDALADFLAVATFHPPLRQAAEQRLAPVLRDARAGRPPWHARLLAHVTLRLALAGDQGTHVREHAERALAMNPLVDPDDHGTHAGMVIHALIIAGEWSAAEAAADAVIGAARRRGDYLAHSSGVFHRAVARYRRGALTAALADLTAAAGTPEAGWRGATGWISFMAAEVQLELGDHAAAAQVLSSAGPVRPDSMEAALLRHTRARLALAEHDPATALALARDAGENLVRTFGIDHPGLLPWRTTAALAAHHLAEHRQAAGLAAAALERAHAVGLDAAIGTALRISGLVTRPGPDTAALSEAVKTLECTTAALEHARALIDLGAALRRTGQGPAARDPLRDGLALADHLHAVRLAERARAELLATGARPRRTAVTGVNALTPAERRVALLALRGESNTAIAQALFITTKTVETHLGRAYRKLGIAGRPQLREAFGPQ